MAADLLQMFWTWLCGPDRDRLADTDFPRSALAFSLTDRKVVEITHGARPWPMGTQLVFQHVYGEERDHHLPDHMANRIAGNWLQRCMRESFLGRTCVRPIYNVVRRILINIGLYPPISFAGAPPLLTRIWLYCLGARGALGFGGLFDFGKRKVTWRLIRDRLLLISRIHKRKVFRIWVLLLVVFFFWGAHELADEADYMGLPMKTKREWVKVMAGYPRFLITALVTSILNFFSLELQFPLLIISILALLVVTDMTFARKL